LNHQTQKTDSGTRYSICGSGSNVVLVHGLGLNQFMWQWQWDALSVQHQLVAYDLLGHGESPKPDGPYLMSQMVDQLDELIDHLEAKPCALVGFSLGGSIVQAYALAHPDKVNALVVLNAAHARTDAQREKILLRVAQAEDEGPAATVDDALARWFSREFADQEPLLLDQIRQWVTSNDHHVYPRVYRLLANADKGLAPAISGIQCPALVMTGEEDFGNSPDMARAMAALIPTARVEILPGLRHMALVENPSLVNQLILEFFLDVLPSK
jgi:pimeloyl-ACP methyl ester carboxylesterase